MMENNVSLRSLREAYPLTTSVLVEALEGFMDSCDFGEYEEPCTCIDCDKFAHEMDSYYGTPTERGIK